MGQVRGEKVKEVIREGLHKLAADAGGKYVLNASELAKATGVSRPTIYRHEEFINEVLKEISAERKFYKGHGVIEFMRERMERLENEKAELKNEVDTLRKHHAKIFEILYYNAVRLSDLVKSEVLKEIEESGCCTLCGQEVDATKFRQVNKVVPLTPRHGKKK